MKLATDKCAFGLQEIQFLWNKITSEGLTPIKPKIATFLRTFKMPKSVKQTKRMIGFFNFDEAFIPERGEKLLPFNRLLKIKTDFEINEEHNNLKETDTRPTISLRNITEAADDQ